MHAFIRAIRVIRGLLRSKNSVAAMPRQGIPMRFPPDAFIERGVELLIHLD